MESLLAFARIELFFDFVAHGEPMPRIPGEFFGWPRYLRSFTKNPFEVEFPEPSEPMQVVYWARWCDATGEVSKWSGPVVTPFVGGVAAAPALPSAQRIIIRRLQARLPGGEQDKTPPMLPDLAA